MRHNSPCNLKYMMLAPPSREGSSGLIKTRMVVTATNYSRPSKQFLSLWVHEVQVQSQQSENFQSFQQCLARHRSCLDKRTVSFQYAGHAWGWNHLRERTLSRKLVSKPAAEHTILANAAGFETSFRHKILSRSCFEAQGCEVLPSILHKIQDSIRFKRRHHVSVCAAQLSHWLRCPWPQDSLPVHPVGDW